MTIHDLIQALELRVLVEGDLSRLVTGGSCGDLLSWVMGRALPDSAWITVMGNVNAVAVAVLADVPITFFCTPALLTLQKIASRAWCWQRMRRWTMPPAKKRKPKA